MPAVKDVGEPCAGDLHARFEVAGAGNGRTRPWRLKLEACRETGRPYADRLPSTTVRTAPAPDPTRSSGAPHTGFLGIVKLVGFGSCILGSEGTRVYGEGAGRGYGPGHEAQALQRVEAVGISPVTRAVVAPSTTLTAVLIPASGRSS